MAELLVRELCVTVRRQVLVADASLTLRAGDLIALVGANGAGKSTLLRAIAGVTAHSGTVTIDGDPVAAMRPVERARRLGWLPQMIPPAWPLKVREAVALGRYAHGGDARALSTTDALAVAAALADCGVEHLADRQTTSLSGGELARVHLARALAGQAPLLLADEPVAALDPAQRLAVMATLRQRADAGTGVLVVLHDIALAARYADRIIAMQHGAIVADGVPADVVTSAMMRRLFGVETEIQHIDGRPLPLVRGISPVDG